jgi:hypothetical protein
MDKTIYIFTDIDGVLNTVTRNDWSPVSCDLYDELCQEFDLRPVITSTWRVNHSKKDLQRIFEYQGITTEIHDVTPVLNEGRGLEILEFLRENPCDGYVIIDDNTRDIESVGLDNVVKCRSWVGFTKEEYDICREILIKITKMP